MGTRQRFIVLDGLRGVAALAVAVRHLCEVFHLPQISGHGYLAVDFFFLLSGFVIVSAYERRLAQTLSIPSFLRIRAVRLYPLIVLATLIGAVVAIAQHASLRHVAELALFSALALPFPSRAGLFPLNGPLWSMFYEVASNIAYVFVRPWLSSRVLIAGLGISAVLVAAVAFRLGDLDVGFDLHRGWAGALRLAWPFLAGVALARLQAADRLPRIAAPAWLLGAALTAVFLAPPGSGPGWAALDAGLSLVLFPLVLALGVQARAGARALWLCAIAGELSYPLYAVHRPIETAMAGLAATQGSTTRALLALACLAVVLFAAFVASRAYDIPIRRWLSARLLHRRMSAPPPEEALENAAISP